MNFVNLTTSCNILSFNKTCGSDWVEIRSVTNMLDLGGPRYCCSSIPTDIILSSSEILILFYSKTQQTQPINGFAANIYHRMSKKFQNVYQN